MNVRGGKFPVGYSGIFRSILHPGGMKRTDNQKVVTALLSESLYKGSNLPHIRLVLAYLIETIYAVTIPNRGLWRVAIGFTDFKSGYCRRGLSNNFRVGANQIPLCSFQTRKAYIPPENRGYVCPGSNLLPENSGYCRHWWRCSARLHFKSNL